MYITWLQSGSLWAPQVWPNMTYWRQLGLQLGQDSEVGPGPFRPSWAQPEPVLRLQCDTLKTCVFTAISDVFGFEVRVRPGCPHWACLGPNFGAKGPHTGPRCACQAQLRPKRAQIAPGWTPVGLKLGRSWSQLARVRRKLGAS